MKKEGLKLSYVFIAIMLFSIVGCKMPWDSTNAPESSIRIIPQNQEVSVTEKISLEIKADNVSNLFATPFYLLYDTNYLKFDTATEGTFLNRNNMDSTQFIFSSDPNRGRIIVGHSRIGQIPGVSGSGVLMTVYFEAINKGNSSINFSNASIKIMTGNNATPKTAPMNFIGCTVNVK